MRQQFLCSQAIPKVLFWRHPKYLVNNILWELLWEGKGLETLPWTLLLLLLPLPFSLPPAPSPAHPPLNLSLKAASMCLMKSHSCVCSSCTEWDVAGYLHGLRNAWTFSGPRKIKSPATPGNEKWGAAPRHLLQALMQHCLIVCLFYFFIKF